MEVCVQSENTIQSDITNSKYNTDNIEERSKKSEEDCVISSVDTIPLDIFNTMPSDALPNDQSEQESQSIVGLPSLPSDNDTFGLNSRRSVYINISLIVNLKTHSHYFCGGCALNELKRICRIETAGRGRTFVVSGVWSKVESDGHGQSHCQ